MLSCGGALRWYRDTLCPGMGYDAITAEAATIPVGCEGMTFLPYLTGERCPHNDPFARASFSGITLGHTHAHFSRSVMEGISFGLLDGMNLLLGLGAHAEQIRVTSGGAKSGFWLQMLADVFQKPCNTLECDEGPAYGAAILAGVGIGIWPNVDEACKATVRIRGSVLPSGLNYDDAYQKYRGLYQD